MTDFGSAGMRDNYQVCDPPANATAGRGVPSYVNRKWPILMQQEVTNIGVDSQGELRPFATDKSHLFPHLPQAKKGLG